MFVCVYSSCTDLQIRHNTVAGAKLGGYYIPGLSCADRTGQTWFVDNYAHSVFGNGVIGVPNLALSNPEACQGVYDFNAFRTSE